MLIKPVSRGSRSTATWSPAGTRAPIREIRVKNDGILAKCTLKSRMDWIPRVIEGSIGRQIDDGGKIVVLYGPRQIGKTSLIKRVLDTGGRKVLSLTGDDASHVARLSTRELAPLRRLTEGYDVLFVDEAQRIPNIGLSLKLLHDHFPSLRIVITGSSSLSLTGRTRTYFLAPLWTGELGVERTPFELEELLPQRLVYGDYPEPTTRSTDADRRRLVDEIAGSYLFRDVLDLSGIKQPEQIVRLAQLLAFQIGSEVSYDELAGKVGMARDTVQRYVTLLEESFVLFRVYGFSGNLRKEVIKKPKIYFWDLGIRNALIKRWEPLELRDDIGALWENFLAVERRTASLYRERPCELRFWRLYTGAEIDLVELCGDKPTGFEIKWSPRRAGAAPGSWRDTYPGAGFETIDRSNWLGFVRPEA